MAHKWVLAGTGSRGIGTFGRNLATDPAFRGHAEIIGLFDSSQVRMDLCKRDIKAPGIPTYTDYDKMLNELKPDGVIIATMDSSHAQYIIKALEHNIDVACEKPVCTTEQQCADILHAAQKSQARALVTHNLRYSPDYNAIKQIVDEGRIGKILTIHYREMLDRVHGASYYRRWHGKVKNSGGLMIHKASHHFDIMNYINGNAKADTLSAVGDLTFYGKAGPYRSKCCRGCPHGKKCEFYIDLTRDQRARELYIAAEEETGYIRDGCVYDPEIDVNDRAVVGYRYQNGVLASYTLCAFAMWEGCEVHVQGQDGLIEYKHQSCTMKDVHSEHGSERVTEKTLKLYIKGQGVENLEIPHVEGGHGGADPLLREEFFIRDRSLTPTPAMASLPEAVQAVLIGLAANQSMKANGATVDIQKLVPDQAG